MFGLTKLLCPHPPDQTSIDFCSLQQLTLALDIAIAEDQPPATMFWILNDVLERSPLLLLQLAEPPLFSSSTLIWAACHE
jgi:hypothetical protein